MFGRRREAVHLLFSLYSFKFIRHAQLTKAAAKTTTIDVKQQYIHLAFVVILNFVAKSP